MKSTTLTAALLAVLAAFGFSRAQHWKGQALHLAQKLEQSPATATVAKPVPPPIYLGEEETETATKSSETINEAMDDVDAATTVLDEEKQALLAEVMVYRQEKEEEALAEAKREEERAQRNAERAVWRQERSKVASSNIVGQVELFSSIDTTYFTPEQRAAFSGLLETMELLNQKISAYGENPESGDEIRHEMHEIFPVLQSQLQTGRETLVQDMFVNDLGYTPAEAMEITKDIDFIHEMTSMRTLMRGVWGDRGGRGGPGGGPPGGR